MTGGGISSAADVMVAMVLFLIRFLTILGLPSGSVDFLVLTFLGLAVDLSSAVAAAGVTAGAATAAVTAVSLFSTSFAGGGGGTVFSTVSLFVFPVGEPFLLVELGLDLKLRKNHNQLLEFPQLKSV